MSHLESPRSLVCSLPFEAGQDKIGLVEGAQLLLDSMELSHKKEFRAPFAFQRLNDTCDYLHHAANELTRLLRRDTFLLTLGGDHSVAIASISALLRRSPNINVIWIDAHGDLNTPITSPSGHLHGMPLACLLGQFQSSSTHAFDWVRPTLDPRRLALVGVRNLDPGEHALIHRLGIKTYTAEQVHRRGMASIAMECVTRFPSDGPIHVSFDVDALDPHFMPCTGTPERKGLGVSDLTILLSYLATNSRFQSMDLVEFNPMLGSESEVQKSLRTIQTILQPINRHLVPSPSHLCAV